MTRTCRDWVKYPTSISRQPCPLHAEILQNETSTLQEHYTATVYEIYIGGKRPEEEKEIRAWRKGKPRTESEDKEREIGGVFLTWFILLKKTEMTARVQENKSKHTRG